MEEFYQHFAKREAGQTKHEQMVSGIVHAISKKNIRKGQPLPSVNSFMKKLSLSRMTVLKALNDLKDRGIVESKNRVGYFVKSENVNQQLKVMLFLTAFNPYQEALYSAFQEELQGRNIVIDLFFHHGNANVMTSILKENIGKYGLYVITPLDDYKVIKQLSKIPEEKLLQIVRPVCSKKEISYVSQDFYTEVIHALNTIKDRIKRYKKFVLVHPTKSYHPSDIKKAFSKFCSDNNIEYLVTERFSIQSNAKGTAYFIIEDSHLISIIKNAEELGFSLGKDIGILSYNDTPMKEIIRQGITVITTDFKLIGKMAAKYALNHKPVREVIKTKIILRNSL